MSNRSIWQIVEETEIKPHKDEIYYRIYEQLLAPIRERPLKIVEVGVFHGGGMLMFAQYLPNARILGIDINQPPEPYDELARKLGTADRTKIMIGSQGDQAFLTKAINSFFGEPMVDLIIDDASHFYDLTKAAFDHLFFNHLIGGGIYCIEDWEAGYWPKWYDGNPDGMHGLPKLIKELVDLAALQARTGVWEGVRALPVERQMSSPILRMVVTAGVVTVFKA